MIETDQVKIMIKIKIDKDRLIYDFEKKDNVIIIRSWRKS